MQGFSGSITQFQTDDTIELPNIIANEDYYNPNTGVLTLYNTQYGKSTSVVGQIQFSTDQDFSQYSFALTPEGNKGTDIELEIRRHPWLIWPIWRSPPTRLRQVLMITIFYSRRLKTTDS